MFWLEVSEKETMVLIRILILCLFVFSDIAVAEIAGSGRGYRSNIFGRPIANITADYFRSGANSRRTQQMEFNRLFERFAGHPDLAESTAAIEKALAFYAKHKYGIDPECGGTTDRQPIQGDWIVVTDYTLSASKHRQFYLNIKTGEVRKAYATHGSGSSYPSPTGQPVSACPPEHVVHCGRGAYMCDIPISFEDESESHKTQTGFFLTGAQNTSGKATFNQGNPPSNGDYNSIILHGATRGTANAQSREVIYHRASYVPGPDGAPNACAFSWGCPATDPQTFEDIKDELVEGTLFYNHTIAENDIPSC